MSDAYALVFADYHQFVIGDPEAFATGEQEVQQNPDPTGLIITPHRTWAYIATGVSIGPVAVNLQLRSEAPSSHGLTEWEDVAEVSLFVRDGEKIATFDLDQNGASFAALAPASGWHRVRVHARGRDERYDLSTDVPVEQYLIEVWRAPFRRAEKVKLTSAAGVSLLAAWGDQGEGFTP
ncbi:hypothetical protein AB6N24_17555 [Cellulomonas sp. 179-A 4D5 NHS]|uniref:hypothetical protein n=1 Tax=Cellulomonas sp. 179-A 4D5 NHS TaxID=3142378 RepID=UPI0039A1FDE1